MSNKLDTGVRKARKPIQLVNTISNRSHSKTAAKLLSCTSLPTHTVLAVKKKVGAMDDTRSGLIQ